MKGADSISNDLYCTLSSFTNQEGGGIILYGIDEKNNYKITGVQNVQFLKSTISEYCNQMEPKISPVFSTVDINGKSVVAIEICECSTFDKPCYYKGKGKYNGSYIRAGKMDNLMSEFEIYDFEIYKKNIKNENRLIDNIKVEDLSQDKLKYYYVKIKEKKSNLSELKIDEILKLQNIVTTFPTILGLILFGEYPQAKFPQLCIIASVVAGIKMGNTTEDGIRFLDDKRIEGTIPEMLEMAIDFVKRNMKSSNEYPINAIREVILNALIHRDYSTYTENCPIQILMYDDRIEITNPGGLFGRTAISQLGKTALDVRNPSLATALEVLDKSMNRYSGIRTIRSEMENHGLRPPVFESRQGYFKVVLYNSAMDEDDIDFKILNFCKTPRSRAEIAKEFEVKSISYFTNRYVLPLVCQGKLRETIANKPKSKNQRYFSV